MAQSLASNRKSITGRLVFSLLVLALAAAILLSRQQIIDELNFRGYKPSTEVGSIARRAGLTDRGMFYFYASRPAVQDRTAFNQSDYKKTTCDNDKASCGCAGDKPPAECGNPAPVAKVVP